MRPILRRGADEVVVLKAPGLDGAVAVAGLVGDEEVPVLPSMVHVSRRVLRQALPLKLVGGITLLLL
jgi:hypothetical protein